MTIKEIAKQANVSIGTVDRVLHNRGRVSEETRHLILKIVEESGYKKNLFASNLANSKKQFCLVVLMPKTYQDSGYWKLVKAGMDKAEAELAPFNTQVDYIYFDRFSEASFSEAYHQVAKLDADGVFMAPVISHAANKCLKETPLTIPFSCFDSYPDFPEQLSYIGQDSFQAGLLGARLMHLLLRSHGTVAVTRMLPEGYHINDRVAGFKHYFKTFPTIPIKEYDVYNQDGETAALAICQRIEQENPSLQGIFVTNANTHYFASYFKEKSVKIVGFDLVEKNRNGIEDGSIDFLITQSPELQGYKGLMQLYRSVILKEESESQYMVPLNIITKENLKYCQKTI